KHQNPTWAASGSELAQSHKASALSTSSTPAPRSCHACRLLDHDTCRATQPRILWTNSNMEEMSRGLWKSANSLPDLPLLDATRQLNWSSPRRRLRTERSTDSLGRQQRSSDRRTHHPSSK